ncbi:MULTISPECIES: AtpZ/AtpI family protein [Nitratireductor]|uniref:AtpZ/AtpI family protein n=1 Tax=Nitratireductor TaxID=245876 RepID=UPI000D0D673C|nr:MULTISPECIES: AtpZ/AtpI family protein [Nitratireductor]PSM18402.1 F0F1 ATP synthase assembly protein I [Nitratireductor sp. StC3]
MAREDDLDRRRRELEAALSARRPETADEGKSAKSGGLVGAGNALKLSSEFIAGIVVGAGVGWMIDRLAGTSPFGLVIFLLLGFCAGVLNALRATGQIAEFGSRSSGKDGDGDDRN